MTLAAEKINELVIGTEHLLGSPDLSQRIKEVDNLADGMIITLADQSRVVMDAFFWRVCALLGVVFMMVISYRVISFLLMRNQIRDRHPDRKSMRGENHGIVNKGVIPTGSDRRDNFCVLHFIDVYHGMAENRIGALAGNIRTTFLQTLPAQGYGPKAGGKE